MAGVLTGEDIRSRLATFAARWSVYAGSERSEAQTFLNELFECYGQNRKDSGARFEDAQKGRFLDLIWRPHCIFEMKKPSEAGRLPAHRPQALAYWSQSSDAAQNEPAPRYVVLCAFRRLEVWEPGQFPGQPRLVLDLIDLPEHYDALLFLAGEEPVFDGGHAAVTREAVAHVVDIYASLRERRAAGPEVLRDFILQSVWCLFAEDLGQLPAHRFTQVVEGLISSPNRSSADDVYQLFAWLNTPASEVRPTHGVGRQMPYANGGLFQEPARVHLEPGELEALRDAAKYDWRRVEPTIFGSLLEGGLGRDQQWKLGAHYTHEADIQKVVQPTIVAPWRERIENLSTHDEARAAQDDMMSYVVLDPACGSGNFLYVAYQELRRLEHRLRQREEELRTSAGLRARKNIGIAEQTSISGFFFPLSNIRGIELDGFAVALARVTLWMGHKLAVDELDLRETTLPLADLSGIRIGDALRTPWPRADAIIGNPPFHGDRHLRGLLGEPYLEWLEQTFRVGIKDYCVYWFRKAHDQLAPGGRAGLVGTNSISQTRARSASLDYITRDGVITSAVSKQPWPGAAVVNVSIVNWIKQPTVAPTRFELDGELVDGISPALRATSRDISQAKRLAANAGHCFYGPIPAGKGFVLKSDDATALLEGEPRYREVVRPYLVGDDIANDPQQHPTRYIIDFGLRSLEEAMEYPEVLQVAELLVKPERTRGYQENYRAWWRFARPLPAMRAALKDLPRYIAGTAQGKRILFCWADAWTCPSNLVTVFAFADDYAMGILNSAIHREWARVQGSTLRVDIRYTPQTSFGTFPWPTPTSTQREGIADIARRLLDRRQAITIERSFGLTRLYNLIDDGAFAEIRKLHDELDRSVADAYGWPTKAALDADTSNRLLLELNVAVTSGATSYSPFAESAL